MGNDTIILTERRIHEISLKTFHRLLASHRELRIKWGSFSDRTKENIWEYFNYLINLSKIHDPDNYDDWSYWQDFFAAFIRGFDEGNSYYDGNFENVVLRTEEQNDTQTLC